MLTIACLRCGNINPTGYVRCLACGAPILDTLRTAAGLQPLPHGQAKAERVFYDEGGILITNTRAVFFQTTYSLANITSVRATDASLENQGCGAVVLGLGIVGILPLFAGLWYVAMVGVVIAIAGWALVKQKVYRVLMTMAGGDTTAFESKSWPQVEQIVTAINSAIAYRG
jgi:hypothetical protein